MGAGKSGGNHALSRTKIHEGLIVSPWEVGGDRLGRTRAYSTHRAQKPSQPSRIGVQRREDVLSSALAFILQFAGAHGLGERSQKP